MLQAGLVFSVLGLILGILYWWTYLRPLGWDTIGTASDPDWDANNCSSDELFGRFNDAGDVATLRESICDWGFGVDTTRYYVFVKRVGESSSRENLVLRIEADIPNTPPPVVTWVSRSRLQISYAGPVSQVTKQVKQRGAITIELTPALPYAGFVLGNRVVFNPRNDWLLTMAFDLLPLPDSAPADPLAATGDFSGGGCNGEFLAISQPTRDALKRLLERLERSRDASGHYPISIAPVSVRGVAYLSQSSTKLRSSALAPTVRIIYHRIRDAYALELRFPDLQPGYRPPTEHYDSAPATAFLNCTAIHTGAITDIWHRGGLFLSSNDSQMPILFTPRLGVYTYEL